MWLTEEWMMATATVRARRGLVLRGFVTASLLFAAIAAFKIRPRVEEIPLVLLAGFLQSVRFVSILALLWCSVMAHIAYHCTFDWAESRWTAHEARRRPGESFRVPYWRFWIIAIVPATLLFAAALAVIFVCLIVLPDYNPVLRRTLAVLLGDDE